MHGHSRRCGFQVRSACHRALLLRSDRRLARTRSKPLSARHQDRALQRCAPLPRAESSALGASRLSGTLCRSKCHVRCWRSRTRFRFLRRCLWNRPRSSSRSGPSDGGWSRRDIRGGSEAPASIRPGSRQVNGLPDRRISAPLRGSGAFGSPVWPARPPPRLLLEFDSPVHVVPAVAPEVVRHQQEEHAPTRLVPDHGTLAFANCGDALRMLSSTFCTRFHISSGCVSARCRSERSPKPWLPNSSVTLSTNSSAAWMNRRASRQGLR